MTALLDRLKYLRSLELPPDIGQGLHPDRLLKFAREGAVAPVSLLNDFGERRRIATLAAQTADLSITVTDATISLNALCGLARMRRALSHHVSMIEMIHLHIA